MGFTASMDIYQSLSAKPGCHSKGSETSAAQQANPQCRTSASSCHLLIEIQQNHIRWVSRAWLEEQGSRLALSSLLCPSQFRFCQASCTLAAPWSDEPSGGHGTLDTALALEVRDGGHKTFRTHENLCCSWERSGIQGSLLMTSVNRHTAPKRGLPSNTDTRNGYCPLELLGSYAWI